MNRHPWATRVFLVGLIEAIAGVFIYAGFGADDVSGWTSVAVAFVAALATLGVLRDGEATTTPVDDPLGQDGLPLLPFRKVEDLQEAVANADLRTAADLLNVELPD